MFEEGEYKNGVFLWKNNERYEGPLENNESSGNGTHFYEDGRVYSGQWKDDKWHGNGRLILKSAEINVS